MALSSWRIKIASPSIGSKSGAGGSVIGGATVVVFFVVVVVVVVGGVVVSGQYSSQPGTQ